MSDLQVISFKPSPDQYAWTFGGAAPAMRIRPPAVLEVYTEDCFAGRVRAETDGGVMAGAHARLRELADEYRS